MKYAEYYKRHGATVRHMADQNSHDLEKCIVLLQQLPDHPGQEMHHVSILGEKEEEEEEEEDEGTHYVGVYRLML